MTVRNITHLFENCIRFAEGLVSNEQAEFGREVDKLLTFCTKAQTVQLNSFFHYHLGQTIMNEPSKICGRQPFKNLKGYGTFNFLCQYVRQDLLTRILTILKIWHRLGTKLSEFPF